MTCFVKSCKNVRRLLLPEMGITFHRFPVDEEVFNRWLAAIGRQNENIVWTKNMFVCSVHFRPDDFKIVAGKRVLKAGACPFLQPRGVASEVEKTAEKSKDIPYASTSKSFSQLNIEATVPTFTKPGHTQRVTPKKRKRSPSVDITASESLPVTPEVTQPSTSRIIQSSGSSSSGSRKRKHFKLEHSYSASPGKIQKRAKDIRKKYIEQSSRLYRARQSVRRLKKRVNSLNTVLKDLKSKHALSTSALEHLQKSFNDIPHSLMSRMLKNVRSKSLSTTKYPEELRKFAITLHFYSVKAYEYVRQTFHLALPHSSTIRKWTSTVECLPGFSKLCFDALKTKVQEAEDLNHIVICSLLLDEISIKKQIDFDGKRYWGYVDIGIDFTHDEVEPAQDALVLMVVCLNASWKLPIGYFLIKSLTAAEKANVINEALIRLHEINIEITSVTCDGPTTHFAMFRELGCDFKNVENLKTHFDHPVRPNTNVSAIFDICHMIKLLRNALAVLQVIIDREGNQIKWEYISKLYDVQEQETLLLANKLGKNHMEWRKQKMKVNLACQTLSNSVAEALLFLKDDLKHPGFQGCEGTVKFIKTVDKMFDLMNSRLPWAKEFKGPLKIENEHHWRPFIEDTIDYILKLKDVNGKFLWKTPRKTPFLGFAISLHSALEIFDAFVKSGKLSYLLTYKLSQDHLELFFCSIRSRNGWNNNPTALQFMRSYRKLLLHADISAKGGNCRVLDTTSILTVTSGGVSVKESLIHQVDIYEVRKNNQYYQEYVDSMQDHNYDVLPKLISLNEFSQNVVTYIAGYVIKMLRRTIYCEECLDLLVEQEPTDESYYLIKRRNMGAYVYPSKSLVTICYETEMFIRRLMNLNDNSLPSADLVEDIIRNVSAKLLHNLGRIIYPNHQHNFYLLKLSINCYCKIRLHNLSKKYTSILQGDLVRKKFNKLILFHHQ